MSKKFWWERSLPDAITAQCWLHPAVVLYLESLLSPDMAVLEFGGGGSTLWFAERVKYVITYEAIDKWADALEAVAPENVKIIRGCLPKEINLFDALLIDGQPVESRAAWIIAAPAIVKRGGLVVLDNANRPEYAKERAWLQKKAAHFITFNVNPPGHSYGVTDFYRIGDGWI